LATRRPNAIQRACTGGAWRGRHQYHARQLPVVPRVGPMTAAEESPTVGIFKTIRSREDRANIDTIKRHDVSFVGGLTPYQAEHVATEKR
jgi:hypothetical protein